eukprot:4577201-Pyramimonas_sp.AAC.1
MGPQEKCEECAKFCGDDGDRDIVPGDANGGDDGGYDDDDGDDDDCDDDADDADGGDDGKE